MNKILFVCKKQIRLYQNLYLKIFHKMNIIHQFTCLNPLFVDTICKNELWRIMVVTRKRFWRKWPNAIWVPFFGVWNRPEEGTYSFFGLKWSKTILVFLRTVKSPRIVVKWGTFIRNVNLGVLGVSWSRGSPGKCLVSRNNSLDPNFLLLGGHAVVWHHHDLGRN